MPKVNVSDDDGYFKFQNCIEELIQIFRNNYCKDMAFQDELSANLLKRTGNDNSGRICREIINF